MEEEIWKIRAVILRKLLKFGKIGGAHTEARNAIKGFPSDKIGQAKKELEWLIKKNYLLCKPSTGEAHVSINSGMLPEIKTLLLRHFKIEEL
ncbi:MAG TPA: hypothetical protein HA224_03480 [Nanoarchaeota archaeon]|nr:hypothetical protein [Nanoarchaeota archaeon]